MNDFLHKPELDELILRKLDGTLTHEEYKSLVSMLAENKQAADYYLDFTLLYASLSEPGKIAFGLDAESLDRNTYNSLLSQLAEEEKIADVSSVFIPGQVSPVLVEGVRERKKRLKTARRISHFNIWFTLTSIAAMLLLVLYVINHPRPVRMQVATLTDSVGAVWKQAEGYSTGTRFMTNDGTQTLVSGLVSITFDYGAEVLLEGPAAFSILSGEKLYLHSGRLYARVPSNAVGFTVDMQSGSVIDLGTEFGVVAHPDGTGDVKLYSGSASLLAGEQGTRRSSRLLEPGLAKRIFGDTGEVRSIVLKPDEFVRRIDSRSGIVWKGQSLDLADLVGKGNGLGTGLLETGIDPLTGQHGNYHSEDRSAENRYVETPFSRYIDGVFVPNGKTAQTVSSKGHIFSECPPTGGLFYSEIVYGSGKYLDDFSGGAPLGQLDGQIYGTMNHPSIFLHANVGITFDLEAIRKDFPFTTCRFSASTGLSTAAPREGNADIWVLVDGQVRFCQKGVTEKGKAFPVTIDLKPGDRFLTLAVTDGGDVDYASDGLRCTDSDWCVFVQPKLFADPADDDDVRPIQ